MKDKTIDRLLVFALFFMAYWFFGNLYEEIVLIPNQLVVNSFEVLTCWQSYFSVTDQAYYYIPGMLVAVMSTFISYFKSKDRVQRSWLKKACIFSMIATSLTIVIVNEINEKIFHDDLTRYKDQLNFYSTLWLVGNAVRLALVGSAMHYLFKTIIHRKGKKNVIGNI
jgi:hypothetical protein